MADVVTTNPYVGPRTFTYAERTRFFGREREARDLLARVVSERVLLFYAQSGAGKSSLLHTRLIPQLREEGFVVLPVGRVSGELPTALTEVANLYLFNLMVSLDPYNRNLAQLAHLSLSHFLARLTSDDGQQWYYAEPPAAPALVVDRAHRKDDDPGLMAAAPTAAKSDEAPDAAAPAQRYVLIIDQFEEIITTHAHRRQDRERFFQQLNQALLADPNLWVVLTLREDYVAALDPYAHLMANKLRARFYMERMGVTAALAAIKQPAALAGRPFAEGVAETLVDNLRRIKVVGAPTEQLGQAVEPVQLQVVCYQLWQRVHLAQPVAATTIPPQITAADLRQHGDVDRALSSFYEEAMQAVLATPGLTISARQLRTWFDTALITPAQTRSTVYQGETETAGLPNQVVAILQAQFLLRTELRAGGVWVELVHDRLVAPIVDANHRWLQQQHTLLRAAQKWMECDRLADFLYADARLDAALREAGAGPFDQVVTEFIEASRARLKTQQLQTQLFRLGTAAVLSLVITVVIFALWTTTRLARNEAVQARDSVQRLRLATESLIQRELAPQRGLLLAVEATTLLDPLTGRAEPQAIQALYRQFDQWRYWRQTLVAHTGRVNGVGFDGAPAPGQPALFSVGSDGRLLRWALTAPAVAEEQLALDTAISAFAQQAAGGLLALGTETGEILIINPARPASPVARWPAYATGERISALAFAADGQTLVTSARGQIHFWPFTAPFTPRLELTLPVQTHCLPECWVRSLAVSADGQWLAAGGEDQRLTLWQLGSAAPPVVINEPFVDTVWAVAFSADRQWLAAGDSTGELRLYALDPTSPSSAPRSLRLPELSAIRTLAFSPVEPWLAIGDGSGVVGLLPIDEPAPALRVLGRLDNELSLAPINAVAFNATGDLLATGGMDRTVRLWQLTPTNREPQEGQGHRQRVRALALYPGPLLADQPAAVDTLVSAGEDATIHFWSMTQPLVHLGTITETGNQILAAAIHPQAQWLATGGRDGRVRLYALDGALPTAPLMLGNHTDQIATVAFSPDGKLLATGGADKRILLWSLDDLAQPPVVLANGNATVLTLAFDRAGARLASGDERWVKLWDLSHSPPTVATLYTHDDWVWKVAFSPDERWLASVSADSMLRLTPLQTGGAAQGPVFAHEQRARSLAFAPDGSRLATAGDDALIRLWDPTDLSKPISEWQGHRGTIYALAFRSSGQQLLSAGDDALIRQWVVDLSELQAMACVRAGRNLTEAEWELSFPSTPYHVTCPAYQSAPPPFGAESR